MKLLLITSFTPGVDTNKDFENALKTFSNHNNAEIKYIQTKEKWKKDIVDL